MLTLNHVLIVLAAGAVWVLFVWVSPVRRKCSWCKGTRRAKKHRWWGRVGLCRKCRGRKKHARFGAQTVHRARALIVAEIRERRDNR